MSKLLSETYMNRAILWALFAHVTMDGSALVGTLFCAASVWSLWRSYRAVTA